LLAVVAFTVINLGLIVLEMEFHFLFSAIIPQVVQYVLYDFIGMMGGFAVALAITSIYLICYALSKRWRFFILVALILFAIDAAVLVLDMLLTGEYFEYLLYVVFHTWILFYLITGTIAWLQLRKLTPQQMTELQAEIKQAEETEEINSAIDTVSHGTGNEQPSEEEKRDSDEYK